MDHLKLREGWRTAVYLDSRGLPTVGLGHLLTTSEKKTYKVGDHVPEDLLNAWAQADAKKAYNAGQAQAATLGVSDQSFINALASVNFQLGTGWYTKHKQTWGYMVAHAWEKAAREVRDSLWYRQTPVRVQDFQAALRALAGTTNAPMTTPTTPAAASGGDGPVKDGKDQGGKPGRTQREEAPTLDAVRAGQAVLYQGHRGPAVSFVQEHLRIAHDGKFGYDTAKAVQAFQARNAKQPLSDGSLLRMDGKIDKQTLDLIERGTGGATVSGTTAPATTGGTDAAIEALDLAPNAKAGAYALKAKHPDIKFTSGRRDRAGQARAMASNVVHNRKWIQQTYASPNKMLLQNWVDSHPKATTVAALTAGLLAVLNGMSDEVLGTISKHPAGLAFDVQPVTKNAEKIKSDIRALPGIGKFLEKEAGLVRWHAPF
jgi:GH24 family phage-related lysozyme (muramidase)